MNWTVSSNRHVSINSNPTEIAVNIYPNPVKSKIIVAGYENQISSLEIFDLSGRKIMAQNEINTNHFTINLENLLPGIFILKLRCKNGESIIQKFSKM